MWHGQASSETECLLPPDSNTSCQPCRAGSSPLLSGIRCTHALPLTPDGHSGDSAAQQRGVAACAAPCKQVQFLHLKRRRAALADARQRASAGPAASGGLCQALPAQLRLSGPSVRESRQDPLLQKIVSGQAGAGQRHPYISTTYVPDTAGRTRLLWTCGDGFDQYARPRPDSPELFLTLLRGERHSIRVDLTSLRLKFDIHAGPACMSTSTLGPGI